MKQGYFPQEIEKRWQRTWEENNAFFTPNDSNTFACFPKFSLALYELTMHDFNVKSRIF